MNTNNGLERKNRDFKDGFLKQLKAKSFSGMLTALIDQFLSETHDRYNPKPFFFLHSESDENIPWSFT